VDQEPGLTMLCAGADASRSPLPVVQVDVRRPGWWCYLERCTNGHEWGPGLVLVSWERYHCAPARAAHPDRHPWGHLTVECAVTGGRSVWYSPPHEPGTALLAGVACSRCQVAGLGTYRGVPGRRSNETPPPSG